jgi:tetratricopeptide (TPR) repeat protein
MQQGHFRSQRKPPESLDAWECVIRALSCVGDVTPASIVDAEALCRRAIAITPRYSQAHSLLAWILVRRTTWSGVIAAVLPEALAEARLALGLDERDAWAHIVNGLVLWRTRRSGEAERAFRRALELNPNFAFGYVYLGAVLATAAAANSSAGGMLRAAATRSSKSLRCTRRSRAPAAQRMAPPRAVF